MPASPATFLGDWFELDGGAGFSATRSYQNRWCVRPTSSIHGVAALLSN